MDLLPALCLGLLICCGASFSHQGSKVTRKVVREDEDALLDCALDGRNIKDEVFDWKKDGSTEVFFYKKGRHYLNGLPGQDGHFKDRVSYFPEQLALGNASIVIRKAQVNDGGNYSCKFPFHEPERRGQYELIVGAAQQPIITLDETTNGMLLKCDVRGAFPKPRVEWWDSAGNVLPADEPQSKEIGGSYNIVLQATVTKSDHYRCVATQDEIHNQIYTKTFVRAPGAAPDPSLTILDETKDWALLQCVVKGVSPKPAVVWKDDSGNVIESEEAKVTERGGSYDVVLRTTVTKDGFYHCVVTQDDIDHQVSAKIKVFFGEYPTGLVVGLSFAIAVLVVVPLAVVFKKVCCKGSRSQRSGLPGTTAASPSVI